MEEIWKDVIGYEGYYKVSNIGNVKSKRRNGTKGCSDWNLLTLSKDKDGYNKVTLNVNGIKKCKRVHRLVADAFIPIPELQINHKNGIRNDNRIENLEWTTSSENVKHSFEVLKKVNSFLGKKHSEESKLKMREHRLGKTSSGSNHSYITINGVEYRGVRVACRELNINRSNLVSKIKNSVNKFRSNGIDYTIDSIKV